jgi:hypothetical protein
VGSYPKLVVSRAWDVAAPEHLLTAELRTVLGAFNLCLSHPSLFFNLSCTGRHAPTGLGQRHDRGTTPRPLS